MMKSKHHKIVESNQRSAWHRRNQPKGDAIFGVVLIMADLTFGAGGLGLVLGVPLALIGMNGIYQGGYPEPHGQRYQRRWLQSVNDDFERIEQGEDPAGDRLRQRLERQHRKGGLNDAIHADRERISRPTG